MTQTQYRLFHGGNPMNPNLTPTEQRTVMLIHAFIAQYGRSPTLRELAQLRGCRNPGSTVVIVEQLEDKGWLYRIPGQARNIRLWFQKAGEVSAS